jgi:hypothetical protein
MTNKQFLVGEIKKMLGRDDLADPERVRLLALLAKHVPAPRTRRKPKVAKPAAHKTAPFPEASMSVPVQALTHHAIEAIMAGQT